MPSSAKPVLLSLAAMLLFATSDVFAKVLSPALHPIEIAWFRYAAAMVVMVPLLLRHRRMLRTGQPALQIARGVALVLATLLLITALGLLPLADATVLAFMSPFLILLLSIVLLREAVPRSSWLAVAIGIAGMLLAIRPAFDQVTFAALLPLCSSFAWSVGIICTRKTVADSLLTTMAWSALTGFVLLSLLLPLVYVPVDPAQLLIAVPTGACWALAHLMVAVAYRMAPASRLAPLSYTQIIWATVFGYVAFATLPDTLTLAGCTLIIGAGLLAAARRRQPVAV